MYSVIMFYSINVYKFHFHLKLSVAFHSTNMLLLHVKEKAHKSCKQKIDDCMVEIVTDNVFYLNQSLIISFTNFHTPAWEQQNGWCSKQAEFKQKTDNIRTCLRT